MKRGFILFLVLVLAFSCSAASAAGTYAVGTKQEARPAGGITPEAVKKALGVEKANRVDNASNGYYHVSWVSPPAQVYGTSINSRVSLSWENRDTSILLFSIYEKVKGKWVYRDASTTTAFTLRYVPDGVHTYGVSSVWYDYTYGDYYESKNVTCVTLSVFDDSDIPGKKDDVQEVNLTGTRDRKLTLTVYDNTYLHIRTDSLTWFTGPSKALVQPDIGSQEYYYTSLGNDFYIRATKHIGTCRVGTYQYTQVRSQTGQPLFLLGANRAVFTLRLNYVPGDAPAPKSATIDGLKYKLDAGAGTAMLTGPAVKTATNVTIPSTITVRGKKYRVTEIAASAFEDMTSLRKVTIGKNVADIGKSAFRDCPYLDSIIIKTTGLTSGSVGANAFRNTGKYAVVKCPGGKKKAYKAFLVKKGVSKKATFK